MSITMLVRVAGECHQSMKTLLQYIKRAAAKIVIQLLNFEQKQRRVDIAQEMLTTFNADPDMLKKVITGDKSGKLCTNTWLRICTRIRWCWGVGWLGFGHRGVCQHGETYDKLEFRRLEEVAVKFFFLYFTSDIVVLVSNKPTQCLLHYGDFNIIRWFPYESVIVVLLLMKSP